MQYKNVTRYGQNYSQRVKPQDVDGHSLQPNLRRRAVFDKNDV
ncbi:hypothetical protein [Okeania sp. SIO2B3]|nr:hypothetical protein [Okeania sp. SIO2B3]